MEPSLPCTFRYGLQSSRRHSDRLNTRSLLSQSSDRTVELSLQRYNKQWEIYQPIQNEPCKSVDWSIGETRCYDDEHYIITGERSTSVWNKSSQTYGAYRERLSTSGKVAEIHLRVSFSYILLALSNGLSIPTSA
jgi:hypothetical protein